MHKLTNNGFTLIELLVVISIISLLSSVVLTSLSGARASARNTQRQQDLRSIQTALEMYYNDHGQYPQTFDSKFFRDGIFVANKNCPDADNGKNWIPGLVENGYINSLPDDPRTGRSTLNERKNPDGSACYVYSSNGKDYILSAWGTVEGGPEYEVMHRHLGPREGSLNQTLCNHPNAGGGADRPNYNHKENFYAHSYTISTVDYCNETPHSWQPHS